MTPTRKDPNVRATSPSQGVPWDAETMERLDREGDEVRRELKARFDTMRTMAPDDLKVRSR